MEDSPKPEAPPKKAMSPLGLGLATAIFAGRAMGRKRKQGPSEVQPAVPKPPTRAVEPETALAAPAKPPSSELESPRKEPPIQSESLEPVQIQAPAPPARGEPSFTELEDLLLGEPRLETALPPPLPPDVEPEPPPLPSIPASNEREEKDASSAPKAEEVSPVEIPEVAEFPKELVPKADPASALPGISTQAEPSQESEPEHPKEPDPEALQSPPSASIETGMVTVRELPIAAELDGPAKNSDSQKASLIEQTEEAFQPPSEDAISAKEVSAPKEREMAPKEPEIPLAEEPTLRDSREDAASPPQQTISTLESPLEPETTFSVLRAFLGKEANEIIGKQQLTDPLPEFPQTKARIASEDRLESPPTVQPVVPPQEAKIAVPSPFALVEAPPSAELPPEISIPAPEPAAAEPPIPELPPEPAEISFVPKMEAVEPAPVEESPQEQLAKIESEKSEEAAPLEGNSSEPIDSISEAELETVGPVLLPLEEPSEEEENVDFLAPCETQTESEIVQETPTEQPWWEGPETNGTQAPDVAHFSEVWREGEIGEIPEMEAPPSAFSPFPFPVTMSGFALPIPTGPVNLSQVFEHVASEESVPRVSFPRPSPQVSTARQRNRITSRMDRKGEDPIAKAIRIFQEAEESRPKEEESGQEDPGQSEPPQPNNPWGFVGVRKRRDKPAISAPKLEDLIHGAHPRSHQALEQLSSLAEIVETSREEENALLDVFRAEVEPEPTSTKVPSAPPPQPIIAEPPKTEQVPGLPRPVIPVPLVAPSEENVAPLGQVNPQKVEQPASQSPTPFAPVHTPPGQTAFLHGQPPPITRPPQPGSTNQIPGVTARVSSKKIQGVGGTRGLDTPNVMPPRQDPPVRPRPAFASPFQTKSPAFIQAQAQAQANAARNPQGKTNAFTGGLKPAAFPTDGDLPMPSLSFATITDKPLPLSPGAPPAETKGLRARSAKTARADVRHILQTQPIEVPVETVEVLAKPKDPLGKKVNWILVLALGLGCGFWAYDMSGMLKKEPERKPIPPDAPDQLPSGVPDISPPEESTPPKPQGQTSEVAEPPPTAPVSQPPGLAQPINILNGFLACRTPEDQLPFILEPPTILRFMQKFHAGKPTNVESQSLRFTEQSEYPDSGEDYYTFDVTLAGASSAFPVRVVHTDSGYRLSWFSYVQFRDDLMRKFVANEWSGWNDFYVILRRVEPPNDLAEEVKALRDWVMLKTPNSAEEILACVEHNSKGFKKLTEHVLWQQKYEMIVGLELERKGTAAPLVKVTDIVHTSWERPH